MNTTNVHSVSFVLWPVFLINYYILSKIKLKLPELSEVKKNVGVSITQVIQSICCANVYRTGLS